MSNLGNEYSVYTYDMLNAGIDRDTLMSINEEQLLCECGIKNKIHRIKIQQGVKVERGEFSSITDEGSTIGKLNNDTTVAKIKKILTTTATIKDHNSSRGY